MLSQQRIVMGKNQSKIGKAFSVLIEAESDEGDGSLTGRSQGEAPEVDGVIRIKGKCDKIGKFIKTRIVDYLDYDLIGIEI
jgi:ribosomal protein S12 methylthiotransferase